MNSNQGDDHLTPIFKEHYENEEQVLRLLLDLEQRYRDYYRNIYQCEIEAQRVIVERLWMLTQRYILIMRSVPGCRYPEVYTLSAEEAIINEYEEKLEVLRSSNNTMKSAVLELYKYCKEFYAAYYKLNMNMETPFIFGDTYHKRISVHKTMVLDIFNYFHATVLKLKAYMHQIDPINLECIEDYRELLHHSEEFEEYLMERFSYCKCLNKRPTCPIEKLKCPPHQALQNLKYVSRI